jgi:F-type H+-transporting ATPase subunit gamma
MAADMKSIKLRIKSVQGTMQITKAMELVASSKLRKAKERADNCKPYFEVLHGTLQDIANGYVGFSSAYVKKPVNDKCCYVVVAGDRGMAGGYNSNVFKCLEADCAGKEIVVLPIGKKAVEYCQRKGIEMVTEEFAVVAEVSVADCFAIANLLCQEFKAGKFGHIELVFTKFISMLSQQPNSVPILPLPDLVADEKDDEKIKKLALTLYDPNPEDVFDVIVPEYLAGLIYSGVCEGLASELASRRTAMDAATKNAGEMIEQLNLFYNRARQAGITQEITEIVAGAEGV